MSPILSTGPLIIQEADQQPNTACYLPELTRYFNRPVEGTCYYVFVDTGEPFPSSAPLFPWPADDSEPVRLRIDGIYRSEFDHLLHSLVAGSLVRRVLVLCELNGNVTWSNPTPEELANLHVRISGPVSIRGFWALVDAGEVVEPSITIIQEALTASRSRGDPSYAHELVSVENCGATVTKVIDLHNFWH